MNFFRFHKQINKSSPGGEMKLFTNENEVSCDGESVKIKWYQNKKTLVFEGPRAKQMEQHIYSIIQSISSFKAGETYNRFDTSNLHNNDKFVEAINDFKLQIQQLKAVMEQNKTAIANLETVCQSSSNDAAYIELHTLRKEYELICSDNAILKKENAEHLERMTNLINITSDLNTKIKILEEEKASLVTSVRLINVDNRQLIMEAKRLGSVYDLKPSPEVSNQATHCKRTQNGKMCVSKS